MLLPSPTDVARAAWDGRETLLRSTWSTAGAALLGLAMAAVVSMVGAVAFLRSRWLELAIYPYALLLQTVPIVAIAPLLVVWLGYGTPVAVATAAIVSFFPLLTAGNVGLRAADPASVDLLRLYGASWSQEVWRLRLPGALPYLMSGLRTAVGLSVIGAIVGEFVGSNGHPPSLGYLVLRSARSAETAMTFAAVAASTALALALFGAVQAIEHRAIGRWHAR